MSEAKRSTFFKNQQVLVTGGTGLVGSNLFKRLLAEGAVVRATVHRRDPIILDDRIGYVKCDLTNREDCRSVVKGIRYIFHCAANTFGAGVTAATPMAPVTPNILIHLQMLEAAYAAQVEKFVWLGSTTGYPSCGNRPVKEEMMFEGEPYDKYFFVGWMNRFTEILCRMYGEKLPRPMTTIVLRPTNIYGPNEDFELATSHVTAALIRKVVERHDPIEVWGTGDDVRDLVYIDDVVEAMMTAIERVDSYVSMNIGLGKGYAVKEILKTILEIDGYTNARVTFNPSKPTMIPIRLIDTTRAQTVLGFTPETDLAEGLRKTIEWYREIRKIPRSDSLCGTRDAI